MVLFPYSVVLPDDSVASDWRKTRKVHGQNGPVQQRRGTPGLKIYDSSKKLEHFIIKKCCFLS